MQTVGGKDSGASGFSVFTGNASIERPGFLSLVQENEANPLPNIINGDLSSCLKWILIQKILANYGSS